MDLHRWWQADPLERYWMEITGRPDLGADLHAPRLDDSGEENPTYGTSRVLLALRAARGRTPRNVDGAASRAIRWLVNAQNPDGGWGGDAGAPSSIEETALATSGLAVCADNEGARLAAGRGAGWLAQTTHHGTSFPSSPIGFYFAKLWYYEKLYPIVLVVEALERLGRRERES